MKEITPVPICLSHNPQEEIGVCIIGEDGDYIITFNDDVDISVGQLIDISIGKVEIVKFKDESKLTVKEFIMKRFIIKGTK